MRRRRKSKNIEKFENSNLMEPDSQERREFIKKGILAAVVLTSSLIPSSDKINKKRRKDKKKERHIPQNIDCTKVSEEDIAPFGHIVYRTEGFPYDKTVVAVKMIHHGYSKKLLQYMHFQFKEITAIGFRLHSKGLRYMGSEGNDPGEINEETIKKSGYAKSSYPPYQMEMRLGHELFSYGIDNTELLEKMISLNKKGRLLEALKVNPQRAKKIGENISGMLNGFSLKCVGVITGGGHFEKKVIPGFLDKYAGKANLIDILENQKINVIVIEPRTYQNLIRLNLESK